MEILDELKFDQSGLIPAIIQDDESNEVLMVAFMNRHALQKTLDSGRVCFWSRSRQEYWIKGETSGHTQT
ncbi:MAG: bifunctional phosphoribosyl-AMP cyclohydrolase/phosphoribosyl-ATP diphosphatase, partial [Candidatus Poribacteria bacterium]|nr:bifunctional phosphoribosyl-AMP cyclohydrolase/phosphoribosyl-ATP diphosphatase [Candidatus Poribacteria bacterium]